MKRLFTIINLAAIAVCLFIGWQTANRIRGFSAEVSWKPGEDVRPEAEGDVRNGTGDAGYQSIVRRDLFHTQRAAKPPSRKPEADVEKLERTELKLKLWGTVTGESVQPYAVIEDLSTRRQELYYPGDSVQQAMVRSIFRDKVVLQSEGRDEILEMESFTGSGSPGAATGGTRPPTAGRLYSINPSASSSPDPSPGAASPATPRREQRIVVPKAQLIGQLENPESVMDGVEITPLSENLEKPGMRLTGIKPRSIFRRLGLRNGDVLESINGKAVASEEDAAALLNHLAEDEQANVQLIRGGRERTINYSVR